MCTPLAIATDSLILLVSFGLMMPVRPWMFWTCLIVWLVLHYCIGLYVAPAPPSTMSAGCCHSLRLPISLCCYCIVELYWLVFLPCVVALYFVFAYAPRSTVSAGLSLFSSPTCLLVLVFLLQDERFVCVAIVYCCLHVATDIDICCWYFVCFRSCWGLSPLPPPLWIPFGLGQVWCLPPIVDWLSDDSAVASVAI